MEGLSAVSAGTEGLLSSRGTAEEQLAASGTYGVGVMGVRDRQLHLQALSSDSWDLTWMQTCRQ